MCAMRDRSSLISTSSSGATSPRATSDAPEPSAQEELDKLRPPIDGNDVMAYLGLEPSRTVGDIMDMLLERRIEDGPYTPEEAYAMLDAWKKAND